MWNRNKTLAALGLVLAGSFLAGTLHLLAMRAETGSYYPPYSTYRADPLGARAFYEGLRALPGMRVERNLAPLRTLGSHRDATCLFLGDSPASKLPESIFETIEEIPARGGRLVIAFAPQAGEAMWEEIEREVEKERERRREKDAEKPKDAEEAPEEPAQAPEDPATLPLPATHSDEEASAPPESVPPAGGPGDQSEAAEDEDAGEDAEEPDREYMKWMTLEERWGMEYAYTSLQPDGAGGYTPLTATRKAAEPGLPERLAWRSALYFLNLSDAWRVLYEAGGHPVAIERDFGPGSMVFISDSFLFSNEAMRQDRQPGLLAWTVGSNRHVIFDETHLGIAEGTGVMVLARQYRMHGLFVALAVLALLYVWKSACPLIPRYESRGEGTIVAQVPGRDAVSGLANLLKRSVPQREILSVCLAEWRQAFGRSPRNAERLNAAETLAARTPQSLNAGMETVEAYKAIAAILSQRGRQT